jgi:hypothetical protein
MQYVAMGQERTHAPQQKEHFVEFLLGTRIVDMDGAVAYLLPGS